MGDGTGLATLVWQQPKTGLARSLFEWVSAMLSFFSDGKQGGVFKSADCVCVDSLWEI